MSGNLSDLTSVFAKAREYFISGRIEEAEKLCNQILSLKEYHFDAMHLLGDISLRKGDFYRAAELLMQLVTLRPDDATAHINLGKARYNLGRLQEASESFMQAVNLQGRQSEGAKLLESTQQEIRSHDQMIASMEASGSPPSIRIDEDERQHKSLRLKTINLAVRLYRHFGYLVLEDLFTSHFIDQLNNYFSGKYAKYYEDKVFDDALLVGNRRNMVSVALEGKFNTPEFYANTFAMPILYRLLHKDLTLYSLGAVVSLPGAKLQHTHRDNYSLFEIDGVDDILPSYAITMGVPLIDMNDTTGTTRFYGTTHRRHGWLLSEQERQKGINPVIRKGSCVLFDYMVFHEGTPNNSDKVRPLMYNIYTRPWFRDIANYSKQDPLNISDEELLKIPEHCRYLLQKTR